MRIFLALAGMIVFGASGGWGTLAHAEECAGNPGALGTSREIQIGADGRGPIGTIQYQRTLPLADHEVVLTFDDGPSDKNTARILDILAADCVKATFFMVGQMVPGAPRLVKRAFDEGHTIGSHTQHHPYNMRRLSLEQVKKEIDGGVASIGAALGDRDMVAPFFRIPGLDRSRAIETYARSRGLMVWSADVDSDDWTRISPAEVVARTLKELKRAGKGVILMHDIHERTALALPELLKQLKYRGYRVVHVRPERGAPPQTAAYEKPSHQEPWDFKWW